MRNFNGKRCIVTGAGRGIGRALALELANCGAHVIAISLTASNLDTLKREASNIETIACDIGKLDELEEKVKPHLPVDMLVNNAGIAYGQSFVDVDVASFDEIFNINFKSAFFLSQLVSKSMISNGIKGSIVHVSSQATKLCFHGHSVYSASKAALDNLTRTMTFELGPHGIRVNAVNPTVVMTDMAQKFWSDPDKAEAMLNRIPLRRFADIEDVVNVIIFLLSDQAKMITGTCLPIDGGSCAV